MFVAFSNGLDVIGCRFYFNKAPSGGAIFAEQPSMYPHLRYSVFVGNHATGCLFFL
jgi:hypothetical protein